MWSSTLSPEESREVYAIRLKKVVEEVSATSDVVEEVNNTCDVESLCKGFLKRIGDLVAKDGGRLPH